MSIVEMRTATITGKGQISIPKEIRSSRFKEGSKVAIVAYKDRIEIRSMEQVSKKIETALASEKSLAKDWNTKEEDEAWKDL